MKRTLFTMIITFCSLFLFAQTENPEDEDIPAGGFRPELLFTGGNINIGFFSGVTALGATPQLGYSITKWLDAGAVFGFTYTSQNDEYSIFKQTIIGPGAFVRIFPVDFIYATAQFEHNFLNQKAVYPGETYRYKTDVNSLLVGLGYTSGREGRNSAYYYFSVSFDVLSNNDSPYREVTVIDPGGPNEYINYERIPVVRAGFNIPLFQGIKNKTRSMD